MNRPPPCGTMGLVAPQDIAAGLVTARSALWVSQAAEGNRVLTPQELANANVMGLSPDRFGTPWTLMAAAIAIGEYVAGIRDTFPVCPLNGPTPPPPSLSTGTGLFLLLGALAIWLLTRRS